MEANWIDIVCGSAILILVGLGMYFGLAKTIVHLIAWIGGAIGVAFAPDILGPFFSENLEFSETTCIILTRVFGFLLPFIILRIAGHFINKFIKRHLSLPNALGGGALGLVKALIPCTILLSVLYLLPLSGSLKQTRDHSVAYSIYTYFLKTSGVEQKIQDTEANIQKSIQDKVNASIDSAKANATQAAKAAAEKAAKEAANASVEKIKAKVQP